MSPTSYQLLYPAMLDYKGRNIFLECKTYFKKYVQKNMFKKKCSKKMFKKYVQKICSDLNHSVGSLLLKFW